MGARRTRENLNCAAALLTGLLASYPLRSDPPESGAYDPASLRVTTDPAAVAGCLPLGALSLSAAEGLDGLRRRAFDRGADVLRLRSLDERTISGELYRCASPTSLPPIPSVAPIRSTPSHPQPPPPPPPATTTPTPPPRSATTEPPGRRPRNAPAPVSSAERQRHAQEELEELKATLRVVEDPAWLEGCEKRGEARFAGADTEDALRADAVSALANVLWLRHAEDGGLRGEFYRCPRQQLMRIPTPTPVPGR